MSDEEVQEVLKRFGYVERVSEEWITKRKYKSYLVDRRNRMDDDPKSSGRKYTITGAETCKT